MTDDINHPSHYTQGKIEVYDFMIDQKLPYTDANIIKYICRYRWKGQALKDLKKAKWYLERLIEKEEGNDELHEES